MYTESIKDLSGAKKTAWEGFLARAGLKPEAEGAETVLLWDEGELIACGSRQGNLLKCIAVAADRQGEGLTAAVLTQLKQNAFAEGYSHLFLYTKPKNRVLFEPLFFYPVAQSKQVLLMETQRNGIRSFVEKMEVPCKEGKIGAIVMNADPFTLGHQYLAETAASQCDWLYIFVLSEDKGHFPARDRLELVRKGTTHLKNVTVQPTGPYLISAATFPGYFLKDKETVDREHGMLDLAVFTKWFVPHFGITHRFAGTEPTCQVTAGYNDSMRELLPQAGVTFCEIPRRELDGFAISASTVRKLLKEGKKEEIQCRVPETTWQYLKEL